MSEVVKRFGESHIKAWMWAFQISNNEHHDIPFTFWPSVYQGFYSAVDYPTCAFYKQLIRVYPNSKVSHDVNVYEAHKLSSLLRFNYDI